MKRLDGTTPQECHNHCIDNQGCVAFTFTFNGGGECNLYEGGPYTKGEGSPGRKCYVMQGTPGISFYNIKIVPGIISIDYTLIKYYKTYYFSGYSMLLIM